jgi:hypothetical protein
MFANTITLTVNAVPFILNRVNQDNYGSEYSYNSGTESMVMKIRHSKDAVDSNGFIMKRHNVFLEHTVFATPTTAARFATYTATARHDQFGIPVQSSDLGKAVNVWLAASTNFADLVAGVN